MLAAMPHLLQDVANLARNIWTMIRMVSSKIPAWLNQPSDEHMQVVRNSKARITQVRDFSHSLLG